jgi:enamine deaminase RidA (YjgF/YER057c/UK114 family)
VGYDIVNPGSLDEPRGWNHGMLAPAGGRVLFVAGQVGAEPGRGVVPGGMVAQWERALENVLAVVHAAGGVAADIGRMTIYVTDRQDYLDGRKPLGEVWRRLMGRHYPALAVVEVKGLVDEGAVVEIEATAVLHG